MLKKIIEQKKTMFNTLRSMKFIEQKAFYFGDGAQMYYDNFDEKKHLRSLDNKYFEFVNKKVKKDKKIAIVGFGCGDAHQEKNLLSQMHKEGYKFLFIGIDSSQEMVNIAEKSFEDTDFDSLFMCGDFTDSNFLEEINKKTEKFDDRLLLFMGATFGNIDSNFMADVLNDMMRTGDKFLIEVYIRENNDPQTTRMLFERYLKYIDYDRDFFFYPLEQFGFKKDNGELFLKIVGEGQSNVLRFVFNFRVLNKCVIEYKGRTMTLLPNTEIELINSRVFLPVDIKKVFQERGFNLMGEDLEENKTGQFLFEKK